MPANIRGATLLQSQQNSTKGAVAIRSSKLRAERRVIEIDGFRIDVYSERNTHNRPHCHITGHGISVTVDIESLEILSGDPKAKRSAIVGLVTKHQERLRREWEKAQPIARQISS